MVERSPCHLVEDAYNGGRFLIIGDEKRMPVELRYEGDAFWITQGQAASPFGRDVSVISRHICSILEEGELDQNHLQEMQMNPRGRRTYSRDQANHRATSAGDQAFHVKHV